MSEKAKQAVNNKMATEFINAAKGFESAEIVRVHKKRQNRMAHQRRVSLDYRFGGRCGGRAYTIERDTTICSQSG